MEKKKNGNWFFRVMIVLFIMFLCLYSMSINGYVESVNMKNTLQTEEQIKDFENDVRKGQYLDMKEYMNKSDLDYSNKVSDFGVYVSDLISVAARKSIELLNNAFTYLFE